MHRIIKMRAKAPNVADLTVIEAATSGLRIGSCQDYLDRCKPCTTLQRHARILQVRLWKKRRIEALNQEKKARMNSGHSRCPGMRTS
jgi:hypothetical protein